MKHLFVALVLTLVCLLSGACAANVDDCDGVWTVSDRFSSDEVETFHRGAARFQAFSGRPVRFVVSPDAPRCHVVPAELPETEAAKARERDMTILVDRQKSANNLEPIIMHELGHLHGLEHVSDPNAVMYPVAGPDFTDADRAECARVNACRQVSAGPDPSPARNPT